MVTPVATGAAVRIRAVGWQPVLGGAVLAAGGAVAFFLSLQDPALVAIWLLGMAFGITLQRGRFCFASAFRDLFLFGQARNMKGIVAGMAVATVGFALIMHNNVPSASFGFLPEQAHILPLGISTAVGGLLFGFGMVVAGGCVSGSLYRMGEGYIGSWVSLGGILVGLGLLSQTWNWWWRTIISAEPKVWLPSVLDLGYGGAVLLTLLALAGTFVFLLWWESRSGLPAVSETPRRDEPQDTLGQKLAAIYRGTLVRGWPVMTAGAVLGGLNILLFLAWKPWGVTGELARWSHGLMDLAGFPPPAPLGLDGLSGCTGAAGAGSIFTPTFGITVGLIFGSFAAALLANEFKLRFPRTATRYVQALGGGVVMGYGAGLAIGCTIGAFFSSVPSLSLAGWAFALALAGGAFLGVQAIKRIP